MYKKVLLLLLLVPGAYGQVSTQPYAFSLDSSRMMYMYRWSTQAGDEYDWAGTAYNDSSWQDTNIRHSMTEKRRGVQWYRNTVHLSGDYNEYDFICVQVWGIPAAYELYWDGRHIFSNGRAAAQREGEIPGTIMNTVKLKREWVHIGAHIIAFRISNHRVNQSGRSPYVMLGHQTAIDAIFNSGFLKKSNIAVKGHLRSRKQPFFKIFEPSAKRQKRSHALPARKVHYEEHRSDPALTGAHGLCFHQIKIVSALPLTEFPFDLITKTMLSLALLS